MTPIAAFTIVALLASAASNSVAQSRPQPPLHLADSSVARIMAQIPDGVPSEVVSDVLRQRTGPQPRAKRDELADSVVARAIRSEAAGGVLDALSGAGKGGDDPRNGTPEMRALDWLIRIHRESLNQEMRLGALLSMTLVVNRGQALPYLIEVATARNDPTSPVALERLRDMATGSGYPVSVRDQREALAALRRMWDEGGVSGLAVVYLREFAWSQRWPKPRR